MRTRHWPEWRSDLWAQERREKAGQTFVLGMLSKGATASHSRGKGLARFLSRWRVPPYLWEAPKTGFILFCYPPATSLIG